MTNEQFFAIIDAKGRFWDGTFPPNLIHTNGKLSTRVDQWNPRMVGKTKGWSLQSTALRKLHKYDVVRLVRPDLPPLTITRFEVRPVAVEAIEPRGISARAATVHVLRMIFGDRFAGDFANLGVADHQGHRYAIVVTHKTRATFRAAQKTNFATALLGTYGLFMNEDDAIMARMIEPGSQIHDLGPIIA
jgi:hypothetical protein